MSRLVASLLGVGHLRPAPGTWGSAVAVLLAFAILEAGGVWLFLVAVAAGAALAVWSIFDVVATLGPSEAKDPTWVVIDELAGQWIALVPVAVGAAATGAAPSALWPGWVSAFLLFRLFDVWKPGPIGWADRRPGAMGVVLDDLLAGVFAAVAVVLLAALGHGLLR